MQGLLGAVAPAILEKINALADADKVPADLIDEASEALATWYFEHDKARLDAVRKDNTGRTFANVQRILAKKFGVDSKELADKPIEDWLAAAEAKIKASAGMNDDEKTKALEDLKVKVSEYESELTKLRDEELPKALQSGDQKVKDYRKEVALLQEISKHTPSGPAQFVQKGLKDVIYSKYDLDLDDNGNIVVMDKNKARIPKSGSKEFKTLEDIVLEEGTASQAFAKSNAGRATPEFTPPEPGQRKPAGNSRYMRPDGTPMSQVERNIVDSEV